MGLFYLKADETVFHKHFYRLGYSAHLCACYAVHIY